MDSDDAEALCAHIVAENARRQRDAAATAVLEHLGYSWNPAIARWFTRDVHGGVTLYEPTPTLRERMVRAEADALAKRTQTTSQGKNAQPAGDNLGF